jgi:hypothetical protein
MTKLTLSLVFLAIMCLPLLSCSSNSTPTAMPVFDIRDANLRLADLPSGFELMSNDLAASARSNAIENLNAIGFPLPTNPNEVATFMNKNGEQFQIIAVLFYYPLTPSNQDKIDNWLNAVTTSLTSDRTTLLMPEMSKFGDKALGFSHRTAGSPLQIDLVSVRRGAVLAIFWSTHASNPTVNMTQIVPIVDSRIATSLGSLFISEQQAIQIALKVAITSSPPLVASDVRPTNVRAEQMTLADAAKRQTHIVQGGRTQENPNTMIWYITMDGSWTNQLLPTPTPLHHFYCIIDASTGRVMYAGASD